jgi:hypothetical protein
LPGGLGIEESGEDRRIPDEMPFWISKALIAEGDIVRNWTRNVPRLDFLAKPFWAMQKGVLVVRNGRTMQGTGHQGG